MKSRYFTLSALRPEIILILVLFIGSLILNLCIDRNPSDWSGLGDPYDYLHQAKFSLLDLEMYFPHNIQGFYPRPFTTPLFYHFANGNPDSIIVMQLFMHSLSIAFLAYSISIFITKKWLKYLVILSIFLFGSWWNILGWTTLLLSESLSNSFLFLWIASFLFLLRKRNKISLIVHLIITLLFAFTRDNWPYLLLIYYGLLILISFFSKEKFWKISLACFCFSLAIFFAQQYSIKIAQRSKLPLINTMLVRIFPNEKYYQWFEKQGMPDMDTVRKRFSGLDINKNEDLIKVFVFYCTGASHPDFFNWINDKGEKTYVHFLVTHPAYSLLMEENHEQLERIYTTNIGMIHAPRKYSLLTSHIFPLFTVWGWLIATTGALITYFRKKQLINIIPCCIGLIFFVNVFFLYNADKLEVERHLFLTEVIIQLLTFWGLAVILDNIHLKSGK